MDEGNTCKDHETAYMRVYRHIDYWLGNALEPGKEYTLEEVRQALLDETGFRFNRVTVRGLIKKYQKSVGISPIVEVYRQNPEYYEKLGDRVRPSRTWKKRRNLIE